MPRWAGAFWGGARCSAARPCACSGLLACGPVTIFPRLYIGSWFLWYSLYVTTWVTILGPFWSIAWKLWSDGPGGERGETSGVSKVFPGKRRLKLSRGETLYFRWTHFGIQSLRGCLFLLFGSTLVVKIKKTQESTPRFLKRITAIRRT